jgi:hypothetical protein
MTCSGRLLLPAVVVLSMFGCKPTLNGPCDAAQLDSLRTATPKMNPADRALITTAGIRDACASRLPSGIIETLSAVTHANPADRATLIVGGLGENLRFANAGCPDWEDAVKKVVTVPPPERAKLLYASCHYERLNLLTEAELGASWQAGGLALIAVPMYAWLVDKGMEEPEAKRLARQMFLGEEPVPPKPPRE